MTHAAVIFDLDGTLIRSRLDFDLIRAEIGLPEKQPILEALDRMSADERRRAEAIVHRHEDEAAIDTELYPGVMEMLTALREMGAPLALMTRNRRESTHRILSDHGLNFDLIRTREDGAIKPSPEPVWEICRTLSVEARHAWVVGDYHYDILCGKAAGARAVYFWEPGLPRPPWADEADYVIQSFSEIIPLVTV